MYFSTFTSNWNNSNRRKFGATMGAIIYKQAYNKLMPY